MNTHKILLVEDDAEISEMLANYLSMENYEVACVADGQEACNQFDSGTFSIVLLDLMIPKISGMEVMQHIRKSSVVPVIIISAKDTEADKTLGLGLGADDYITKPFSVVEVLARIKANIRRTTQYDNNTPIAAPIILTAGDLVMNLSDYTVTNQGTPVELKAKEFDILKLLMQNPTQVVTKSLLLDRISTDTPDCTESSLKMHISNLRKKLREVNNKEYIEAVWGIGFKMRAE